MTFLNLRASLGPKVYFIFSLQFDAYVLSHRIHTYKNTVFDTEEIATKSIMSLSMDLLVGKLPRNMFTVDRQLSLKWPHKFFFNLYRKRSLQHRSLKMQSVSHQHHLDIYRLQQFPPESKPSVLFTVNFPHLVFPVLYWFYHGLLLHTHKPQPQALHRMKADHELAYRTVTGMKELCSAVRSSKMCGIKHCCHGGDNGWAGRAEGRWIT